MYCMFGSSRISVRIARRSWCSNHCLLVVSVSRVGVVSCRVVYYSFALSCYACPVFFWFCFCSPSPVFGVAMWSVFCSRCRWGLRCITSVLAAESHRWSLFRLALALFPSKAALDGCICVVRNASASVVSR
ncbi:hypothetical protein OH76DRAFT_653727 [Lentinus brumalis]|uniref:Uncharacterized protein n=1 Tax=Lentinus brumalis TaxID=2498619 RepID=A0A371D7B4_9APHY|nr:hypothetical protein OH76DRAFT_653727 [Polyporus brumalis]